MSPILFFVYRMTLPVASLHSQEKASPCVRRAGNHDYKPKVNQKQIIKKASTNYS